MANKTKLKEAFDALNRACQGGCGKVQQPTWRNIGHVGDVDPIAYGGGFVYEDETGVYCPEMAYFEPAPDEDSPLHVYRVLLERDSTQEWWYADLSSVASYAGLTLGEAQRVANGYHNGTGDAVQRFDSLLRRR